MFQILTFHVSSSENQDKTTWMARHLPSMSLLLCMSLGSVELCLALRWLLSCFMECNCPSVMYCILCCLRLFFISSLLLTVWFVPINLEYQDSTLVWFPDLLQSGQEAQGQWCCRRLCRWSSSKQNTFPTDRTWGKLACASEWTHLNSGDTQNSSARQSDGSNCASYWFHAISRYLDTACCFIKSSDGKPNEICNSGN